MKGRNLPNVLKNGMPELIFCTSAKENHMDCAIALKARKARSTKTWTMRIVFLILAIGLNSQRLLAQDVSKIDLFGGYQYTHLQPNLNLNGWNASVTGNFNSWFGVKLDFSGAYKSGGKMQTY